MVHTWHSGCLERRSVPKAWAQIRLGVQNLDDKQVAALAGEVYRDLSNRIGDRRDHLVAHSWTWFWCGCDLLDQEEANVPFRTWTESLERFHGPNVDKILSPREMTLGAGTRSRLLLAAHRAAKLASDVVLRQTQGDWSPDQNAGRFPDLVVVEPPNPKHQFDAVWTAWLSQTKPSAGTIRRWKPVWEKLLASFQGHAPTTQSRRYGKVSLKQRVDAIRRIPRIEVGGAA